MKTKDYRLHKFLRKYGAVRKFKANLNKREVPYSERLDQGESAKTIIGMVFTWCETPEGCEYWSDLDRKYKEEFE